MAEAQFTAVSSVEYRDIPGIPGYRVGIDGSVWSSWRRVGRGPGRGSMVVAGQTWRRLVPHINGRTGYPVVTLGRGDGRKKYLVHRLVTAAFIGPCPPGLEVAHENGIPADCRLANLAYKTKSANQQDRLRHGTHSLGTKSPTAKLTERLVADIRGAVAGGASFRRLAAQHGVSHGTISKAARGLSWPHVPKPFVAIARRPIAEVAAEVLRETGRPSVGWGDTSLLRQIAARAGLRPNGRTTETHVLANLVRSPGVLVRQRLFIAGFWVSRYALPSPEVPCDH